MVRVKHRYLVAQILYPEAPSISTSNPSSDAALEFHRSTPSHITSAHLIRLLRDTIAEVFGEYGSGVTSSSLAIKYFSPTTSNLILRCSRDQSRLVWAALTLITHLPCVEDGRYRSGIRGVPCMIRVLRNSGTIRKCEEMIVEMARRDIGRAKGIETSKDDGLTGLELGFDDGGVDMDREVQDGAEDQDENEED